jgi:predicted aconitase
VKLDDAHKRTLDGERGEIASRMMRLLVRLGEVFGADAMVEIGSSQVSGVSYKSIGRPGLEFLEDVAEKGARVTVPTFLNPAGMDLEDWRALGFPESFARDQERIIAAYRKMGITLSASCTPYLAGNVPELGEHVAWAESSAVSFANSVLGARTNREGGPSALAAAICGCTPDHGLHKAENRKATVVVQVDAVLRSRADFGALGCHVGKLVEGGVPYFRGISWAGRDHLKTLGAAMAARGAVALYHVEGVTPEAGSQTTEGLDSIGVGQRDLDQTRAELDTGKSPDHIVIGCPHASLDEIAEIAGKLEGRTLTRPLWVCTSRTAKETAAGMGLVGIIERAGGQVVADTCMVVAPIEKMGFFVTGVDSGKAAAYLPGFCGQEVAYRDLDALLEEALS